MVNITGTTIRMTRGDTLQVEVVLTGSDGNKYVPGAGDVIKFGVKKTYTDTDLAIYKIIPSDTLILLLRPEDTKNLAWGSYVYDIEITMEDGTVDTFIANATIVIEKEVV